MVWPCRCFETHSYRPILKDYFRRGARWTAAPRPPLTDELFDPEFRLPEKDEPISYILTEFEPVFDAADFFRCGRDLFVIRSNVTNASGVEWLRRHLEDGYRIHEIESRCQNPMHIDTTILRRNPQASHATNRFADRIQCGSQRSQRRQSVPLWRTCSPTNPQRSRPAREASH